MRQHPEANHRFKFNIFVPVLLIAVLFLLVSAPSYAQRDSTYQNNTILLPALSTSPETSFMFGGVGIYQFKPGDAGSETRPSYLLASAIYTLNKQFMGSLNPMFILPEEKWILNGVYGYNYFPESYWGIGPETTAENELTMRNRQIYFEQNALKKVAPHFFIGPQARWIRTFDLEFENDEGRIVDLPTITGASRHTSVGVGLILRVDARNSTITPTQNYFADFSMMTHPEWLGTTAAYTAWRLDLRRYFDLADDGSSVLALHSFTRLTSGHPPIKDMAMLGGQSILRGYYEGRFRDRNGSQLQAEYRQHIMGRLGFTTFAGAGEVWNQFGDFTLSHLKWSAGGGLRFNLNRKDPMNLRLDVGFGENTSGFYLTLGEAF